MPVEVLMPQLGESVLEGTITKWLKAKGEQVSEYEPLLEVNTDKVDTEIPSPTSGVLLDILVGEGTTVKAGSLLAWIGENGESLPSGGSEPAAAAETPLGRRATSRPRPKASPLVARATWDSSLLWWHA
jgi:2-oxoglutarate dehydrogenase E2 component (dihydrolipoamide succinyltransferase)